ncbi:MAG: fatty acid desaturase family protein [Bacteroidota bacterium]
MNKSIIHLAQNAMSHFDARSLKISVDKKALKPLYQTESYRHVLDIVLNWVLMIGAAVLCTLYFNPITYILAVIVIGARLHALAILMHDATHFRFLKNKKWNDLITNFTCMYPIFTSIEAYRTNHLKHHQNLNTEDDPDWFAKLGRKDFTFPKTKKEFFLTLFSYFFLIKGLSDALWIFGRISKQHKPKNKSLMSKLPVIVFYVLLITTLILTGGWYYYLLFWIIPYFSTFFMFQYIRSVAEHFGELSYDHLLTSTRTIKAHFVERFFFAPHQVSYHLEHHLYPGVPYYNLPKLHNLLMSDPFYAEKAHITHGFVKGFFNELGYYEASQKKAEKAPVLG